MNSYMIEVEAKVPVTAKEYSALKKKLSKMGTFLGSLLSSDTYYEQSKKAQIRLRQTNRKNIFTIKHRQTIKRVESNIELEWGILDLAAWRRLLKKYGFNPQVKKFKKSYSFRFNDFNIELNTIRHLGHYLEVEKTVDRRSEVPSVKNRLIAIYRRLGYTNKQFEPRPYLQLLKNV